MVKFSEINKLIRVQFIRIDILKLMSNTIVHVLDGF